MEETEGGDDIFSAASLSCTGKVEQMSSGFFQSEPGKPPLDSMGRRPKTGFGAHIFHSEGIKISAETSDDFETARVVPVVASTSWEIILRVLSHLGSIDLVYCAQNVLAAADAEQPRV